MMLMSATRMPAVAAAQIWLRHVDRMTPCYLDNAERNSTPLWNWALRKADPGVANQECRPARSL